MVKQINTVLSNLSTFSHEFLVLEKHKETPNTVLACGETQRSTDLPCPSKFAKAMFGQSLLGCRGLANGQLSYSKTWTAADF